MEASGPARLVARRPRKRLTPSATRRWSPWLSRISPPS